MATASFNLNRPQHYHNGSTQLRFFFGWSCYLFAEPILYTLQRGYKAAHERTFLGQPPQFVLCALIPLS